MPSSYLNLMRSGPESFNCKVTISGTLFTLGSYFGSSLSTTRPLLFRFSPTLTSEVIVEANAPPADFGAATFGRANTDATPRSIWVGVQYVSASSIQLVFAYQPFYDSLPTVTFANATNNSNIAATTAGNSNPIVWLGKYAGVTRNAGLWGTTSAQFFACGPGGHPGPRILANSSEI